MQTSWNDKQYNSLIKYANDNTPKVLRFTLHSFSKPDGPKAILTLGSDDACKGKWIPVVLARDVIIDKYFVCNCFNHLLMDWMIMNRGWQLIVSSKIVSWVLILSSIVSIDV